MCLDYYDSNLMLGTASTLTPLDQSFWVTWSLAKKKPIGFIHQSERTNEPLAEPIS